MAGNDRNSDLTELLSKLVADRVRLLIVGGHAVAKYGEPRYTKDVERFHANIKHQQNLAAHDVRQQQVLN